MFKWYTYFKNFQAKFQVCDSEEFLNKTISTNYEEFHDFRDFSNENISSILHFSEISRNLIRRFSFIRCQWAVKDRGLW